MKIVVT